MNLWLLLFAWAACLIHAAPLAESSVLAVDEGTTSTGAVTSLSDPWADGVKDESYSAIETSKGGSTEKPAQTFGDSMPAGTFHPDYKNPAFMGRAMLDTSHEGPTEELDHIFWERVGMDNDTESGDDNLSSPANAGDVAVGGIGTELQPKYSIQILIFEQDGKHSWFMYQGPCGVAVNPCWGDQFRTIVTKFPENRDINFHDPPYVGQGVWWDVDFPGGPHCWYESRANDPGHLVCDGGLDLPFKKDAGNKGNAEGIYHCWKTSGIKTTHWYFYPAWVLEYGGTDKVEIDMRRSTPTQSLQKAEIDVQSPLTNSIQILLFEQDGRHSWFIYIGPYNVPANPCIDGGGPGFKNLAEHYPEDRKIDFMNPPYIKAGFRMAVPIDTHGGCIYYSMADNPGILECGGGARNYTFYKDAGNNDKTKIHCWKNEDSQTANWYFHRAWVFEYQSPPRTVKRAFSEALSSRGDMSNTTESGMNASSPSIVLTEPKWKRSLQIRLLKKFGRFTWYMYQGPSGIAVDPCNPGKFTAVVTGYGADRQMNFQDPPFVREGAKWDVNIEGWSERGHCRYEASADNPGHLVCDEFLNFPFSKDVGNTLDSEIICRKRAGKHTELWYFHRAWVLEY